MLRRRSVEMSDGKGTYLREARISENGPPYKRSRAASTDLAGTASDALSPESLRGVGRGGR
jgi:hypothetical protein